MSNENAQSQIERIRRNNVHKPISKDFFHLIPQSGVHHTIFPEEVTHNAIWDCKVLKNGRVFFTLCAELADAQCVRLYEYLPETASFRLCFRLEEHVFQQERGIRTSKIHTSISEMNDGRLIMTTHTTARSPYHPTWMPRQYYSHQWEGYQGSVVLIYDPNTGSIENRGIPIPRESIYGGVYDPAHHAFFFTGWFRGHLYRLDIDTNEIRDFGQVTEYGSFRLHRGPDGHIYGNSRSGNFYRLNTDTLELKDVATFPNDCGNMSETHRQLQFITNAPDGCIYMSIYYHEQLLRYDPKREILESVGSFWPEDYPKDRFDYCIMQGLTVDDDGAFWYAVVGCYQPQESTLMQLCKWDLLHGGKPQGFGLLGSEKKRVATLSEMIYREGVLYISDTNHLTQTPGILTVDLAKTEKEFRESGSGPISQDPSAYAHLQNAEELLPDFLEKIRPVQAFFDETDRINQFLGENNPAFEVKKVTFIRLWRILGTERSPVSQIYWRDSRTLLVQCVGRAGSEVVTIVDGAVTGVEAAEPFPEQLPMPEHLLALQYPSVPGRQYIAKPTAFCSYRNGYLVGTKDGMLARVTGERVYSLGSCAPHGPVHALTSVPDSPYVYGVAGDPMDLGMVFRYSDEEGLEQLGCVFDESYEKECIYFSAELSCCALSPDGATLAIGAKDRMGMVYLYQLRERP